MLRLSSLFVRGCLVLVGVGLILSCGRSDQAATGPREEGDSGAAEVVDVADVLPNGSEPFPGVWTGGQPSEEQLGAASRAGVRTVINLRRPGEQGTAGERERVEALGMTYVSIPIAGGEDLDETNARTLAEALEAAERPVIVHCRSGNRVGGLFAMHAYYVEGADPAEALEIGKAAGLTALEDEVRRRLEKDGP